MEKLLKKYVTFVSQLNPPTWWKITRFLLHWLTLPIKLLVIGMTIAVMQVYMLVAWRNRKVNKITDDSERAYYLQKIMQELPVFDNAYLQLYVNRVHVSELPTGSNHNTDHQAARQGTYHFILSKLGAVNEKVRNATRLHIQKKFGACRGYRYDVSGNLVFNGVHTSGDQLLGLLLSLDTKDPSVNEEEYAYAISSIIDNDYALLHEDGKVKSDRGMWQPGLETVGAQAMTILAALKMGEVLGNREAKKHYSKLIWKYGYGLLSLFPTAFVPKNRGYFNDHNCMIAAYLLAKHSTGLSKKYWQLVTFIVWSLSYKWYNPYFTGLLNEVAPNLLPKSYIKKCEDYLYEAEPLTYSRDWAKEFETNKFPVAFNEMNQGEFWPDEPHMPIYFGSEAAQNRSGLGFLAAAVMINPEKAKGYLS